MDNKDEHGITQYDEENPCGANKSDVKIRTKQVISAVESIITTCKIDTF